MRNAIYSNKGDSSTSPENARVISRMRLMFFCQEGSKPLCTSINGTPITLLAFTEPLIMSAASAVILMFTSLSLSCLKIFVSSSRSFFSTAIITSSMVSPSIIWCILLRSLYFFIEAGKLRLLLPLVFKKLVIE